MAANVGGIALSVVAFEKQQYQLTTKVHYMQSVEGTSSSHNSGNAVLPAVVWKMVSAHRWERSDNAVVKYDEKANCMYAKPWSKAHRGWMIYKPTDEYPVGYRTKRGFNVPIKYSTAEKAIKAIDALCPIQ